MPQLDRALIKTRAARLRERGEALYAAHLARMTGTVQTLLIENNGMAHTENFTSVATPGFKPRDLVSAVIAGHNGRHLTIDLQAASAA